jgi:carboxylesterase
LHKIACPTLVIHSREDHLVSMANAKRIAASVSSDDVRLLWLNNSYHVSTLDNDKELILQRAGDFFTELARS